MKLIILYYLFKVVNNLYFILYFTYIFNQKVEINFIVDAEGGSTILF